MSGKSEIGNRKSEIVPEALHCDAQGYIQPLKARAKRRVLQACAAKGLKVETAASLLRQQTQRGTCSGCGCVDSMACPGGCSWVDAAHTVCSACIDRFLFAPTKAQFFRLLKATQNARLLDVLAEVMRKRIAEQGELVIAVDVRAIQIKLPEKSARLGLRIGRGGA